MAGPAATVLFPHDDVGFLTCGARLSVHSTQEWYDIASESRTKDLAKFFDFYLNDVENGWEETTPVRISLLGYNLPNEVQSLPALPWTQPDSKTLKLHLNADQSMYDPSSLTRKADIGNTTLSYQADVPAKQVDNDPGELRFKYIFPQKTLLAGPSKLVVHMSAETQNGLDVYAQLRKADASGTILQYVNVPIADLGVASASDVPAVSTLKYLGPTGQLRASMRAVAPELSTPYWQTLSHERVQVQPVPSREVVRLEVFIWPTGIVFEAGESLVLKIAGHDMALAEFEHLQGAFRVVNKGKHFVHFGSEKENYLELYIL
jgi:predicted acyl esterase